MISFSFVRALLSGITVIILLYSNYSGGPSPDLSTGVQGTYCYTLLRIVLMADLRYRYFAINIRVYRDVLLSIGKLFDRDMFFRYSARTTTY